MSILLVTKYKNIINPKNTVTSGLSLDIPLCKYTW